MKFFGELKRRNLFRVAGVYAVVGWLLAQAAVVLETSLGFPGWFDGVVVGFLLIGFPVAMVLAWAFEMTPEGVKLTKTVSEGESIAAGTGRRLDYAILAGLALVAALIVAERLTRSPSETDIVQSDAQTESVAPANDATATMDSAASIDRSSAAPADGAATEKSVAVLPFIALSSGEDDGYFADGLTEEILNSLAALPDLLVTARTSSFYFKDKDVPVTEIAGTLGVAHVVEGSVRRAGDKIRVTAQLIRALDGFHLWSETYDRELEDVFQIQTDVAEKVAGALSIYLDDEQREAIARSGTRNVEAFKAFLKGRSLFDRAHASEPGVSLWDANEEFERAMALDPKYVAPAIRHHDSFAHYLMDGPGGAYLKEPRGRAPSSEEDARQRLLADLDRAIDNAHTQTERIVAQLYEVYFSSTWARMPGLIEQLREKGSIEKAGALDIWLTVILSLNGEFETLRKIYDYKLKTDPLRGGNWSSYAAILSALGEFDAAEDAIERGRAMAGDHPWLYDDELFLAVARYDKAAVLALLRRPAPKGSEWRAAYLAAVEGDYERATALAEKIDAENPRPQHQLLRVYNETGDAARAAALTKRIDDLAAGPAILGRTIAITHHMLFFDLADAPNFSARLEEAGIDPASFRPMPRLSVGDEEE